MTRWKVFPRSLLDRPALQSHGFVVFSKARHMNPTSITPSIQETLSMIFLFISHLTTHKKNTDLYSEGGKDAQPWEQMGKPHRQPSHFLTCGTAAVPRPCDTSSLLRSRRTKPTASVSPGTPCNSLTCLSCITGRGHRPREKQSSRPGASPNSSSCLKVIHLPAPALPSVKCQESYFGLHFPVLRDILIWSSTQ